MAQQHKACLSNGSGGAQFLATAARAPWNFVFAHCVLKSQRLRPEETAHGTRYGTLIAWAESLGRADVIRLLTTNLNEEKAADKKLSTVAVRKGVNRKAAG